MVFKNNLSFFDLPENVFTGGDWSSEILSANFSNASYYSSKIFQYSRVK